MLINMIKTTKRLWVGAVLAVVGFAILTQLPHHFHGMEDLAGF